MKLISFHSTQKKKEISTFPKTKIIQRFLREAIEFIVKHLNQHHDDYTFIFYCYHPALSVKSLRPRFDQSFVQGKEHCINKMAKLESQDTDK